LTNDLLEVRNVGCVVHLRREEFLALLPRIDLALSAEHQNHKSLSKLEAPAEIVPRRIIARGTKPSGASSGLMWSAAGSVTSSIQRSHLPSILPRYTLT